MEEQNTKEKEEKRNEQAIILPIDEKDYSNFINTKNTKRSRKQIVELLASYPELFPSGMEEKNWSFYGTRGSTKTNYKVRVIG